MATQSARLLRSLASTIPLSRPSLLNVPFRVQSGFIGPRHRQLRLQSNFSQHDAHPRTSPSASVSSIAKAISNDASNPSPPPNTAPEQTIPEPPTHSAARETAINNPYPNAPKEYQDIETSLDNSALHPNAPWGFVLIRTAYGADTDAAFARILDELTRDNYLALQDARQAHLFPRHELTVIEDETALNGADSHTVRDAFRAWVAQDLTPRLRQHERFGGMARVREMLRMGGADARNDPNHPLFCMPARWVFCLWVDDAVLRSFTQAVDSGNLNPSIKVVTTDFGGERVETTAEGWDDGATDDACEDVGWTWFDFDCGGYLELYRDLVDGSYYDEFYVRPWTGYVEGADYPGYAGSDVHGEGSVDVQDRDQPDAEFVVAGWWKEYGPR